MKLGTQTGSMTNHIYSRMVKGQPTPQVGMGATILCWTDRHAATITAVNSHLGDRPIVTVQEDHVVRTDSNGMCECQTWEHTPNPGGRSYNFRASKTGVWQQVIWNAGTRRWNKVDGHGLRIGDRAHYHDFSF